MKFWIGVTLFSGSDVNLDLLPSPYRSRVLLVGSNCLCPCDTVFLILFSALSNLNKYFFRKKTNTHHQNTRFLTLFAGVCVHAKIAFTGSVGGKKKQLNTKETKDQQNKHKKFDQQCVVMVI